MDDRSVRQFAQNLDLEFMGGGEWVCTTRVPPLSPEECAAVVAEAEEAASAKRETTAAAATAGEGGGNGWGTARHYAVPTTDMAVRDLPRTLAWFNTAMRTRIGPLVAAAAALGSGEFDGPGEEHFFDKNESVCDSDRFGGVNERVDAEKSTEDLYVKGDVRASFDNTRNWRKGADRGAACGDGSVISDGDHPYTLFGSQSEAKSLSESRSNPSRTVEGEAQDGAAGAAAASDAAAGAASAAAGAATAAGAAGAAGAAADASGGPGASDTAGASGGGLSLIHI